MEEVRLSPLAAFFYGVNWYFYLSLINMRSPFLITAFLICFFSGFVISQTSNTITLFYSINQVQPLSYKSLDSTLAILKGKTLKVKITGYADFLSQADYNLLLSQKRAEAVKEYIISNKNISIISCRGVGEKFSSEKDTREGEPSQRRVEIVIETDESRQSPIAKEDTKVKEEPIKEESEKNIEDLSLGESLALEGLNFEPGRHFITKSAVPVLQKLLATLKENKNLKIQIQGHVCCTNETDDGLDYDTHEYKLSENRAKAIYDFLISKGISSSRLSYKGYGHSKPKFSTESTPEQEQANRRVEIMIIEK